jgi:Cdc6-like AAA superfamily ATPase
VDNASERFCGELPVDALGQRRVSDLIHELDTFGLVSAAVVSEPFRADAGDRSVRRGRARP